MARPLKQGMDYFPHDCDARNDLKIRKLRALYGNDGYATYFILLENIYRQKDYELNVMDGETSLILAEECRVTEERFREILLKCIDLDLFDKEKFEECKILTSQAIKRRSDAVENERKRKREWKNTKTRKVLDVESIGSSDILDGENIGESTQRKEKKRKEK